jgi:hypothetical protein
MSWSRLDSNSVHLDPFEKHNPIVPDLSKCCGGLGQMCFVIDVPLVPGISSTFIVGELVANTVRTILPYDSFEELPPFPYTYPIHDPVHQPAHQHTI